MKTRCTDAYYARRPSGSAGILYRDEWFDGAMRAVAECREKSAEPAAGHFMVPASES